MKLKTLHLERFGARSNLELDHLSEHLNVICGPNGSGKSTLIQFIRWILFGARDPASHPFLAGDPLHAAGFLTVLDGSRRLQVVSRRDDGTPRGQVRIQELHGGPVTAFDPDRLTGIEPEEFCQVFSIDFDQPPRLEELVRSAVARGFGLTFDEHQLRRLQQVNERIASLRESLYRLSGIESSTRVLDDRSRQIQEQMEVVRRRRADRLREIEQACQELATQLHQHRQRRTDWETIGRRTDQQIELRQQQLDAATREAAQLRQQWLEQRQQEVAEIDYQLDQWYRVLDTLRQRQQALQARVPSEEAAAVPREGGDEVELRSLLRTLGYQIDDIEQDLHDAWLTEHVPDDRVHSEYLRSVLGTALYSMRADVQRLYQELQQQRSATQYHDLKREATHLRRCEQELTDLIEMLARRRKTLIQPEDPSASRSEPGWSPWERDYNGDALPYYLDQRTVLSGASEAPFVSRTFTDPVLHARLQYLLRRRDYLLERIREIDLALEATQSRFEQLQQSRDYLEEDRELERLQQELDSLGEQLRRRQECEQIREEIARLEQESEQLRSALQPSPILQEASSYLSAMSDRELTRIRISEAGEIWVENQGGSGIRYVELSRGARDQVYLSLGLALVAAYRQRGIELPLILNEALVNVDQKRARSTAAALAQFAERGHQVLLFTRDEQVSRLLPQGSAKTYTLRERVRPIGPPLERPSVPSAPIEPRTRRIEPQYLDQVAPPAGPPPSPRVDRPEEPRIVRREPAYDWVAQWAPPRRVSPLDSAPTGEPWPTSPREETPLSELSAPLDPSIVRSLHEIGVSTVQQFLEIDPDDIARRLNLPHVPAANIYRWQSEISLQCHVGLSPSDAALLVACGVDDPEELSYIDVTELHRRIEQYLSTSELRARYGSISRFERPRLARWIEAARRSRFRRYRIRDNGNGPTHRSPRMEPRTPVAPRPEPVARRVAPSRSVPTTPVAVAAPTEAPTKAREEALRFFLEPSDPVVDAPSIGPKTAERLQVVGLKTVADLLAADAQQAADEINYRRITADLVRAWQTQTRLVCRTPNLRGHDAQILVACGITSPEELTEANESDLLSRVQQFVRSPEGKRILRNSPAPDADEVNAWIRWAHKARSVN